MFTSFLVAFLVIFALCFLYFFLDSSEESELKQGPRGGSYYERRSSKSGLLYRHYV